jgi:hypothetical protein
MHRATDALWSGTGEDDRRAVRCPAHNGSSERRVVAVQYTRQEVVRMLRKSGFGEVADEAMRDLPVPVDLDHVQDWRQHGITRDVLISQMGGSP